MHQPLPAETVVRQKVGPVRLELACLLALLFVALNMLDAQLTSLAISLGSSEANKMAVKFGFDIALKAGLSALLVAPLLLGRWWRVLVLLCAGMLCVVGWNALAVYTWS